MSDSKQPLDFTPASVQVAPVKVDGKDVQVVESSDSSATHWSVYLRGDDGLARWQADFEIKNSHALARTSALLKSAALSMEHAIPIEKYV
jgi:hypothetical protein